MNGWLCGCMHVMVACRERCEDCRGTCARTHTYSYTDTMHVDTHNTELSLTEARQMKNRKKLQKGQRKTSKFKWKILLSSPLFLPLSLPSSPVLPLPPSNAPVLHNKNDNTFSETHTQTHTCTHRHTHSGHCIGKRERLLSTIFHY